MSKHRIKVQTRNNGEKIFIVQERNPLKYSLEDLIVYFLISITSVFLLPSFIICLFEYDDLEEFKTEEEAKQEVEHIKQQQVIERNIKTLNKSIEKGLNIKSTTYIKC